MRVWTVVVALTVALGMTAACDKAKDTATTEGVSKAATPKTVTKPAEAVPTKVVKSAQPAEAPAAKPVEAAKPAEVTAKKPAEATKKPVEAAKKPVEASKPAEVTAKKPAEVAQKPAAEATKKLIEVTTGKSLGATPAGLSACRLMRHAKSSAVKGKLIPTFMAAAKLMDPKNKAIVDDATAKKESCEDKDECGPQKAASVLTRMEDFGQVVLVKRAGGDGYWMFDNVWETFQVAVTHVFKPLGDTMRVGVNVPLYERVPFCEDGDEDDPENCTTATAEVGAHYTDHVIDPKTGTIVWTAFCELGESEVESGSDPKITREGDRYTYTSCTKGLPAVTFTAAHLATCPSPEANKLAEVKKHINRGRGAARKKQYADAIAHFDEALTVDPMSANAFAERGYAKYKAGKLKDAEKDLKAAIREASPSKKRFMGAVYYNLGLVAEASKDKKAALIAFTKSVENRPNKYAQKKLDALKK